MNDKCYTTKRASMHHGYLNNQDTVTKGYILSSLSARVYTNTCTIINYVDNLDKPLGSFCNTTKLNISFDEYGSNRG